MQKIPRLSMPTPRHFHAERQPEKNVEKNRMLRRIRQQVLITARRHVSASVAGDNRFILLEDDDGKSMKFPGIWLRDNCQCSECFHPPTGTRLINWNAFNPKVKVKSVQIASDDALPRSVKVEWNDEHRCEFDWRWLKQRDFSLQNRQKALKETYPLPDLWSAKEFSSKLQRFDFDEVLRSDCALYDWIQALAVQGVAVISNAGDISGRVTKLANRIGFMKRTTYGEEFLVTSKPDATNYAYFMGGLPLHTDMPYFVYMPGVIVLHYLIQSSSDGGANTICDGFYVARRLKWEYPEFYEILSSTPVDWYDIGAEGELSFNSCHRAPVICLDSEGNCTRINHNQTRRDSHFRIDMDKVIPWYEAFSKFVELSQNETAEFKMQQGEVLSFNNLRLLHGRTAYKDTDDNTRCLEGTYVDWDIIYSKLRVLRSTLYPAN